MQTIESNPRVFVAEVYRRMEERLRYVRKRLGRPLTMARSCFWPPARSRGARIWSPEESYLLLRPDRVAMQDATAQNGAAPVMSAGDSGDGGALYGPLRPPHPGAGGRAGDLEAAERRRTARSTISSRRHPRSTASASGNRGASIIHQG